ncbi:MAG: SH3 domain-containing protein [Deltaproteobacteria bacterium]|jgi:hypothetical protein|nr:SH3 domain-containing protein [Deltaproteobacteria bacterium]
MNVALRARVLCLLLEAGFVLGPGACAVRPSLPDFAAADAQIAADLAEVPQDLFFFADKADLLSPPPLLSPRRQSEIAAGAIVRFFSPWSEKTPPPPSSDAQGLSAGSLPATLRFLLELNPERMFAENLRPLPLQSWEALLRNCAFSAYTGRSLPGISVRACDLRLLPTRRPCFLDPGRPGQGYPFDYLQNSSLPIGSPLRIFHLSQDGAWAWVESPSASGWAELDALALVDERFTLDWRSLPMAVITSENTALRARPQEPLSLEEGMTPPRFASIGTILPYAGGGENPGEALTLLFPEKKSDGYARPRRASLPSSSASLWPLPLTRRSLAALAGQMLGQPYGWGGYGGNRDCSSSLRDLFLPFGVWLPRNSVAQAALGRKLSLSGLTAEQKEALILEEAGPFLSLLGRPGHIALYVGEHAGRAVIFHNIWGLRIQGPDSATSGRAVIGKAVLTTLSPGRERRDLLNSLLDTLDSLSFPLQEE